MGIWTNVSELDIGSINDDLVEGVPTADVVIHYPTNLDEPHREKVNSALLLHGMEKAKQVFGVAGVQLNLVALRTGVLDPRYFAINSTAPGSELPGGRYANLYVEAERSPSILSREGEEVFSAMITDEEGADRTVHLIVLQDVFMNFHEQLDERTWQLKTISTGGLSFPGYMYGATMPRHLRGAITITNLNKDENSWKTIAHELGHKLLNVSHEYRETAPAHEVRADGGLMLYGKGAEIASGREGRYHQERLHRSPYLYRRAADGSRTWNDDYVGDGFYYDPLYDGISVDLDSE